MYVVASSTLGTLKIRQCAITVYTVTPTFDVAVLFINNACWDGVPFLMKASKALHTKRANIRVQFKHVLRNLYKRSFGSDINQVVNELVIHVQPDETIYLQINDNFPNLGIIGRSHMHMNDYYLMPLRVNVDSSFWSDELDAACALLTYLWNEQQ
ncbi:unnamed protein product [Sphagnum troendelagicum]